MTATDSNGLRDEVGVVLHKDVKSAWDFAEALADGTGMTGYGVVHLIGEDGVTKSVTPFANLITTSGDKYYAQMGGALVGTPQTAQPTKVTGMKLGTATTAATKSTAGSANISSGSYLTGSNVTFGSTYPQMSAKAGTDTGWYVTYQATWNAGVATSGGINEVSIVTDQSNNADGSSVANTIARATIGTVIKLAGDTLQITWNHLFLGA